jgi:hypothetical protein
LTGFASSGMDTVGRRLDHEGGFFRPCSRCGRRTFWLCEDCGPPSLPGVRYR